MFLLVLTIWLVIEAFNRIFIKYTIDGPVMLITAVLSLIFNIVMMDILHQGGHDHDHGHGHDHDHSHHHEGGHHEEKIAHGHGHGHGHDSEDNRKMSLSAKKSKMASEKEKKRNINVDAAYLHVLGDLLMSVGVTIAATVIYIWPTDQYPWSKYVDPACTLLFSIMVCMTCKKTLSGCFYILMQGAPESVDQEALQQDIQDLRDGVSVHDLHLWQMSRGKNVMSAHVRCQGNPMEMLRLATQVCNDYGIQQCTIQVMDVTDENVKGLLD